MTREHIARSIEAVKEDHQLLLRQIHSLEQMLALAWDGEPQETRVCSVLEQLRRPFLQDLLRHMAQEECEFFPAVEQLTGGDWKVNRLRVEHAQLREMIGEFRGGLTLVQYVAAESRPSLYWRLIGDARAILGRLRSHAAFEFELTRELNGTAGGRPGQLPVVARQSNHSEPVGHNS